MSSHAVCLNQTAQACSSLDPQCLTAWQVAEAVKNAKLTFVVEVDSGSRRGSTRNMIRFVRNADGQKSKPLSLTRVRKAIVARASSPKIGMARSAFGQVAASEA